jgi:hypothetical protein
MIAPRALLSGIPTGLRDPLLKSYEEIVLNYLEHRWEPSELNGGKFCEVVYSIISGALGGAFLSAPSKPSNMQAACRALEQIMADPARPGDRSLRILIPRLLPALYEIRNNRGVGHVGGDVDPNYLDATAIQQLASWILAELIRIFHSISTNEAQETVDALVERKHPLVWEFEETRRVLDPKMLKSDQTLLLLHAKAGWVDELLIAQWVEYKNSTNFRAKILRPLHKKRLIEFEETKKRVRISPLGVTEVEGRILKTR